MPTNYRDKNESIAAIPFPLKCAMLECTVSELLALKFLSACSYKCETMGVTTRVD